MAEPLTTDRLLLIAAQAGRRITRKTLESWSYKGLLPRPNRVGQDRRRPIWVYPRGTDEQLQSIIEWQANGARTLDGVRVGLWVEGYEIPWDAAKRSVLALLDRTFNRLVKALEPYGGFDPKRPAKTARAIEELAHKDAGRRGKNYPGARSVRMKRAERAEAIAYMRRILLGLEAQGEPLPSPARHVVRDLGVKQRGGPDLARRLFGVAPTVLANLGRVGGIPGVRGAIETATDEEVAAARAFSRVATIGFAPMAKVLESALGVSPGELTRTSARPLPSELATLIGALIAGFRRASDEDIVRQFGRQPPLPVLQKEAERMGKRTEGALAEDAGQFLSEIASMVGDARSPRARGHAAKPRSEGGEEV